MTLDRKIIGAIVERQMRRTRTLGSWPALERASGVSRSTLYRIRDADPRVEAATFERVGAALGLPYDALITAATHDLDGLVELGVDHELVHWVGKEIAKAASESLPDVGNAI
ncbi:hypothetical protein GCM10009740_35240 [Terrabacter terrae]|uniref:HTH cro/C1-type domain-containing protein n=1 Tax=Terrabacter terrae TaxID=318434 RepID=A0ABN2UMK4_9MICO